MKMRLRIFSVVLALGVLIFLLGSSDLPITSAALPQSGMFAPTEIATRTYTVTPAAQKSADTAAHVSGLVVPKGAGTITRISVASDGTQGNGDSAWNTPRFSSNGRYVVFNSTASNLVPGDTNGADDVFVYDRQGNQISRVSVSSEGAQGNYGSGGPSISEDGRYVAFHSLSSNLVNDDTNNNFDVFVHDRQTGQTTRVSIASDGAQGIGYYGSSLWPSISADGRYVAFTSRAYNLVPNDTNPGCEQHYQPSGQCADVFVHDRATGQTTRVSVASDGTEGNRLYRK